MKFACVNAKCAQNGQPGDFDLGISETVFKNKTANQQGKLAPKCTACKKSMKIWKPAFAWNFTALQLQALNGQYDPQGVTNDRPTTGTSTEAVWYYNGKHFLQENKGKGFGVYLPDLNRVDVRRMEDYAIAHGFGADGERFFRFSEEVGYDGVSSQTTSIRVDTGSVQHSHPVPENAGGMVSHDGKIKSTIIMYSENNNHEGLVEIAQYLTIIGATRGSISLTLSETEKQRFRVKGASVPPSAFWNSPQV